MRSSSIAMLEIEQHFLQASGAFGDKSSRDLSGTPAALLKLPVPSREVAYTECVDCFAAMIADPQVCVPLSSTFVRWWQ